jgi:3-hydroxyacyl-[acyl-carrier-protein] dehydratase
VRAALLLAQQGGNRKPAAANTFTALRVARGGQFRKSEIKVTTSTILPASDINEILKHIPHRYPFLLIDRMEACEPNKWVRVIKNVSANDWFFAGLPAARRVMPQMLVLEALAQAAGVLCHFSGLTVGMHRLIIFFAGIENAQFRSDVVPGDRVVFECLLKRAKQGVVKLHCKATVCEKAIVETELTAVIRDMAEVSKKT